MRITFLAGLALVAAASSALADAGVRPVWSDFQPAVSTQYRGPDGGRRYLKPDTRQLIHPRDRQAADRAANEMRGKQANRTPATDLGKRPAATPTPGSSTDPLLSPSPVPDPLATPAAKTPPVDARRPRAGRVPRTPPASSGPTTDPLGTLSPTDPVLTPPSDPGQPAPPRRPMQ